MKIAIDLNDVVREYSYNFLKYYCEGYDRTFNPDDMDFWTNDMQAVFPFKTDRDYQKFTYEDYAFELFGKCENTTRTLTSDLSVWYDELGNIEEEKIDVMFVSTMEQGESIGYSYFFISKLGPKIRETFFPVHSEDIWDRCDVLITADPKLLDTKPEGKKTVKIKTDYNKECAADFAYRDLSSFLQDMNNTVKLIENA